MLTGTVDWHNVDGTNNFSFNSDTCPLNDFDIQPGLRIDVSRRKMMAHGGRASG